MAMNSVSKSGSRFPWWQSLIISLVLWGICIGCLRLLNEYRNIPPDWIKAALENQGDKDEIKADAIVYSSDSFAFVLQGAGDNTSAKCIETYFKELKEAENPLGASENKEKKSPGAKAKSPTNRQHSIGRWMEKILLSQPNSDNKSQDSGIKLPEGALSIDQVDCKEDGSLVKNATMPHGHYVVQIKAQEPLVRKGDVLAFKRDDGMGNRVWVYQPGFYTLMAYYQHCQQCKTDTLKLWSDVCYTGILCFVMVFGFGCILSFVRDDQPEFTSKYLWVYGICYCCHLLVALVCVRLYFANVESGVNYYLFALMPAALGPSLCAILLGRRIGVASAMWLSILTAILVGNGYEFQLFIQGLICSMVGVLVFQKTGKRSPFFWGIAGIVVTMMAFSCFFCFQHEQLHYLQEWMFLLNLLLACFFNSAAVICGLMLLPFIFERCFDVTTVWTWKELNDNSHVLLRRLQEEAPGTYEHSMAVSRLAEAAARATGLDANVAAACALFHDVGKLFAPKKFGENLLSGEENIHDKLEPLESCTLVREHLDNGEILAKKHHLPGVVREAIRQHHGTGVMQGFYNKACNEAEENGLPIPDEKDYSYTNGQCPIRAEVVLVAMADAIEAAVRSMVEHTSMPSSDMIRQKVEDIIRQKIAERQFDEAHLTMSKFRRALESMISSLIAMHHVRPEYEQRTVVTEDTH